MATEIIMPKAGMSMEFGTVVKWLKNEGDSIEKGDPVIEIMTDKVNMEVEAEVSGVLLKILAQEGQELPVFTTIGYIGKEGEVIGTKQVENPIEVKAKSETSYDVIVIGGGPAGYVAAIKAAQLGGKVALVEKDIVGGTCLNRGCIPTKTYLKNAEIIHSMSHAAQRGIHFKDISVELDMDQVVAEKDRVVKMLTGGVQGLLKSYGVDLIKGTGRITLDKKVIIDKDTILEGNKIILAGGSKVARINIPGIESVLVLDSTQILDLKEIPEHLAIIGGGVIGVEMASIFRAYGSQVTIIEMMDRIVPPMDVEVSQELAKHLKADGINILTSSVVEKLVEKEGKLEIFLKDKASIIADKALLSIGRVPDLDGIGDLDFKMERGKIKVNDQMESSVQGVYAPGDINGLNMLAHAAYKMGEIAAINAMGAHEKVLLANVPSCIYTMPEVAAVGLTEEQAKAKYDISVGRFNFGANGRALSTGEAVGFVKVIIDKKYGEILGVHIIGPSASETINEAAALMEMEITIHEAAEIIHGHPSYSEAFLEACNDALGVCVHLPKKRSH